MVDLPVVRSMMIQCSTKGAGRGVTRGLPRLLWRPYAIGDVAGSPARVPLTGQSSPHFVLLPGIFQPAGSRDQPSPPPHATYDRPHM
jgi:hypothetical protein